MKATIDFDDALYRRLKVEAARRGTTIRELVAQGVRQVLGASASGGTTESAPDWLGALSKYAGNAKGGHELPAVRESVARGRPRRK